MHEPNTGLTSQVPKVWNGEKWENLVVFPEATNEVQGDVWLSDAVDSEENAEIGMTAATPLAVKTVQDNANNKLDKTEGGEVAGDTKFSGKLIGNLTGNASSASELDHEHTFSVTLGSDESAAKFSATSTLASSTTDINVTNIPVSLLSGTISPTNLPAGAMDKLVQVEDQAARFKLTTASVQTGDSVLQQDTEVLYLVVDDSNLDKAEGYQEYKAGSAVKAAQADKLSAGRTITLKGDVSGGFTFDGSTDVSANLTIASNAVTTAKIADSNVTTSKIAVSAVTTDKIDNGAVTADKIDSSVCYAGSSSNGGAAKSADMFSTNSNLQWTGDVTGNLTFNGSEEKAVSAKLTIANSAVTNGKIANGVVTSDKLSVENSVNNTKGAVATNNIQTGAVTEAKINSRAITAAKMNTNTGVVFVGQEGTDETKIDAAYKIWIVTK